MAAHLRTNRHTHEDFFLPFRTIFRTCFSPFPLFFSRGDATMFNEDVFLLRETRNKMLSSVEPFGGRRENKRVERLIVSSRTDRVRRLSIH